MAEGVFQSLVTSSSPSTQRLITTIDSSGTGAYHVGDTPDPRTMATLKENGITNYKHMARKFAPASDFENFDYILAMDDSNLEDLEDLRRRAVKRKGGDEGLGKVMLFGEFGGKVRRGGRGEEIRDPYYGANDGFTTAYEQAVKFSKVFLERLERGELS